MISEDIYRQTVTPEARQQLDQLAERVAAARHLVPVQVTEQGVSGWIIDERPVTIGEDDYEFWNWSDVVILGQDGSLHGGRRQKTESVSYSHASDELTVNLIDVEAWDLFHLETPGADPRQRSWFKAGTYASPRYADHLSRTLLRFEESGEYVTDYRSKIPQPVPCYNKAGIRSAVSQFIRRCLFLTAGFVAIVALMKGAEVIGSDPKHPEHFPAGSARTIAWSFVFVAFAGLIIDLVTALKANDDRYRSAIDEATPFLVGAALGLCAFGYLLLNHKVPPGSTSYWWIIPISGVVAYVVAAFRRSWKQSRL